MIRSFTTFLLLVATVLGSAVAASAAADPFYSSRYREGVAAAERGNHTDAVRSLRIACFGLLEEDLLAECLVRLGLSQSAAGDAEGFNHTFRRLVEAEELLSVFSRAELDEGLVAAYRARVEQLVPEAIWLGTLGWTKESAASTLAVEPSPPPNSAEPTARQRRRDLQRGQELNPGDPSWSVDLARLEQQEDRPKAALSAAQTALELAPADPAASCVAAWANSRLDNCRGTTAYLANCDVPGSLLRLEGARCAIEVEAWQDAERWLDGLQVPAGSEATVGALRAQVEAGIAASSVIPQPEPSPTTATGPASGDVAATESPVPAETPPVSEGPEALPIGDQLESIRQELTAASQVSQLNDLYETTTRLLEEHGEDREAHFLAAEIAYRASRWQDAVRHFEAAGDPGDGNPRLLFYLSISQYEAGDRAAAQRTLERCIDRLSRSPFVERYRIRILGDG